MTEGGKYRALKYDDSRKEEWDAFVESSRNGTIFHKQRFLSYHPRGRFKDSSLLITKGGGLAAVFPAAAHKEEGKKVLFSHPGSSYGGAVIPLRSALADAFGIVGAVLQYAKDEGFDAIEIRHAPRVYQRAPSEELDFALSYAGFGYSKRELSSAISLRQISGEGMPECLRYSAVKAVRKARREGLFFSETSEPAHIETFHGLLVKNLRERHGAAPTHSLEEIVRLKGLFPEDIKLFAAFLKGRPIGFLMVFVCNPKAVHIFYTAQDFSMSTEFRPINFIYYNLIKWAKAGGFDYINIGISTEEGGKKINWKLFNFKETLGGTGVRRDSYRLDLEKTAKTKR